MSESLKDLMKLAGMTATKLAEELQMEYGQLSTVLAMDAAGEAPKRQSVRARTEAVRQHLESLQRIANRAGSADAGSRRRAEFWDSVDEAARRFRGPAGAAFRYEHGPHKFGSRVRLQLDPGASAETFRFFRVVTPIKFPPYAELFSTETGACRAVRLIELETKVRIHQQQKEAS